MSRLNRVFIVTAEGERCLVLEIADRSTGARLAREAAVLNWLWSAGPTDLSWALPPVVAYDSAEAVLILVAARGARDLSQHYASGRFSRALASQAGKGLARLHEIDPAAAAGLPGRA